MAVTVDFVLIGLSNQTASVLLIKRRNVPFKDQWALPGGYVDMDEKIEEAALRELSEETGAQVNNVEFLGFFDAVDRDPRERTVSFTFWATTKIDTQNIEAADDASDARWHLLEKLPHLAFDHADIIKRAISRFESAS
jgi:8-oxo-dGTP diphosphatase